MSNGSLERECVSEGIVEADRYDVSHSIGGFTSPAALQRAPGTEDKTAEGGTVLRGNSAPEEKISDRDAVVNNDAQEMEWTTDSSPPLGHCD